MQHRQDGASQEVAAAYALISELERLRIVVEHTQARRGKSYCFISYLDLFVKHKTGEAPTR